MLTRDIDGRITYFDNLKFILITAVVVGHAADYYTETSIMMRYIYLFIYTFHMPLFVFVSGFFSKGIINKPTFRIEKNISYFLVYVIMQSGIFLMKLLVMRVENPRFNFFTAAGTPWYLMAMMLWLGIMYLLKDIKREYLLILTILIALIAGYDTNVRYFLCLSRVIVFFPFFILGYYAEEIDITKILENKYLKIFSIIFLCCIALLILAKGDFIYQFRGYLNARNPYVEINVLHLEFAWIYRLLIYGLMLIMSLAVLYITPKFKIPFITKIGSRTLQIYVLHYFVLRIANYSGWLEPLKDIFPNTWKWIYLLLSIILTFLLSAKIFEYPFKKIMNIRIDNIYKNRS